MSTDYRGQITKVEIIKIKIVKTRDLHMKSPNDTANKITSKKRNAASNSLRFAYLLGHCLFILLYWGGNGNT
jgi:hypothetical protein